MTPPAWLTDPLFLRPLAAGIALAVLGAPLGCLVVWRRVAFFGETLAHVALPGIAVALLLGLPPFAGALTAALITAALFALLEGELPAQTDSLLATLAHVGLSAGLIVLAVSGRIRIDPMALLVGDILALSPADAAITLGLAAAGLLLIARTWRSLVFIALHRDLAQVSGIPARAFDLAFLAGLSAYVALATRLVGVLLVTSLLVIPAFAAQARARTPEGAAVIAAALAAGAVAVGLTLSFLWDWPSGPAVVVAAGAAFALCRIPFRRSR